MIAFDYGIEAAIGFILFVTFIHAMMEMNFDKRATEVFDTDDTRTQEELDIIHRNQLPIRGLAIVSYTLAADMQMALPTLALLGVALTAFWILFDIFCAVLWLGKPWYYAGDPPPYNLDPYLFFFIKGTLFSLCLFAYIALSNATLTPSALLLSLDVLLENH